MFMSDSSVWQFCLIVLSDRFFDSYVWHIGLIVISDSSVLKLGLKVFSDRYVWEFCLIVIFDSSVQKLCLIFMADTFVLLDPIGSQYVKGYISHFFFCPGFQISTSYNQISAPRRNQGYQDNQTIKMIKKIKSTRV